MCKGDAPHNGHLGLVDGGLGLGHGLLALVGKVLRGVVAHALGRRLGLALKALQLQGGNMTMSAFSNRHQQQGTGGDTQQLLVNQIVEWLA